MNARENILETIKTEMITLIQTAQLDNLISVENELAQLFRYGHYLNECINEMEPTEQNTEYRYATHNRGIFKRLLVHGSIVISESENIFVPESIVREMDLNDGDLIEYKPFKDSTPQKPHYEYMIIERNTEYSQSSRKVFDKGIVESYQGTLFIQKNSQGETLQEIAGQPYYYINDYEKEKYNIVVGNVVDIAWLNGRFKPMARVVWKYSLAQETMTTS